MTRDEIKNKLLDILKETLAQENPNKGITQMNTLVDSIRELIPQDTPSHLHVEYHRHVFEIVNEWHLAGILHFGRPDDPNSGHPWITITEFGKECIQTGNFLPYDPEGYIRELQAQVPSLDDVSITYIRESISTYSREHLLSATITLGVASENIVLNLIDTFADAIQDPQKQTSLKKSIEDKSIYARYKIFMTELKKYSNQISKDLTKDLESQLDAVFNFIRITRNQAGHPTGQTPSKKVVGSNLQIFAEYSKRVFDLINYFQTNKLK